MLSKDNFIEVFKEFERKKVLIIGDVMIDAYLWGKVDRISPEAPVPIVSVNKRENRLGGAANVALNIKSMGAEAILCSVIGKDAKAEEFKDLLKAENMSTACIHESTERITTTKFRIIGNKYQMLRVDEEVTHDLNEEDLRQLYLLIENTLNEHQINAIIFQDYNKGILTPGLIQKVIDLANRKNIPTIVDPKKANFDTFRNVTLFKPNLKELKEGLKTDFNAKNRNELNTVVQLLHNNQKIDIVLTTLSEDGVYVSARSENNTFKTYHIPAHIRRISDVSGAGDTVVSVASLALAAGLQTYDIACISNLAGGIVCEEVGVVPINKKRLIEETLKIYSA